MKNNIPEVNHHHHHLLRLPGYDYSGEGLYFITICTKDRQHSFGKISEREMILDEIGITAEMMLAEVSRHFSHAMAWPHRMACPQLPSSLTMALRATTRRTFPAMCVLFNHCLKCDS